MRHITPLVFYITINIQEAISTLKPKGKATIRGVTRNLHFRFKHMVSQWHKHIGIKKGLLLLVESKDGNYCVLLIVVGDIDSYNVNLMKEKDVKIVMERSQLRNFSDLLLRRGVAAN